MPNYFPRNLEYLREKRGLKQAEIARELSLKRSTYANYESGETEPKFETIESIVRFFGITADKLLFSDLTHVQLTDVSEKEENVLLNVPGTVQPTDINAALETLEETVNIHKKAGLKLPKFEAPKVVTIDTSGDENAVYVPVRARAGYLLGYGDPAYIGKLPAFRLPGLTNGTYRIFEVEGLSMFPTLQDRDKVIARWVPVAEIRDDRVHVLITKNDGMLIKRVLNRLEAGKLVCKSDNNHRPSNPTKEGEYPNIVLDIDEVLEAWYVVERWTRTLPSPGEIYKRIVDLEADMALIKQKLGKLPTGS